MAGRPAGRLALDHEPINGCCRVRAGAAGRVKDEPTSRRCQCLRRALDDSNWRVHFEAASALVRAEAITALRGARFRHDRNRCIARACRFKDTSMADYWLKKSF